MHAFQKLSAHTRKARNHLNSDILKRIALTKEVEGGNEQERQKRQGDDV